MGRRLSVWAWRGAHGPALLGIVNVTPDSFSDGGRRAATAAVAHGLALLAEGADWLDVGGESTRPGAAPVEASEEMDRVLPVVEGLLRERPELVISVDTSKPDVAAAALGLGARIVNDVSGLSDPGMIAVIAAAGAAAIAMHRRGDPATMDRFCAYTDLGGDVAAWLDARARAAVSAGVSPDRIAIDPGLGFAKRGQQNADLVRALGQLTATGWPVAVGASRKRFVGELTGVEVASERASGSVGAALAAAAKGASVLRIHDVAATRQALAVFRACGGLSP